MLTNCPNKRKCNVDHCERFHSDTLHGAYMEGVIHQVTSHSNSNVLLQMMAIPVFKKSTSVNVIWDSGSNCSLITFDMAK